MSQPLSVHRVLGDRPFAEVGTPSVVVGDPEHELIVVGGDLGYLQWSGSGTAGRRGHRIGAYDVDGARCRWAVDSRWPVRSIALHPTLPLAAVGTGAYDGGYAFEGELLLIDLESGRVTPATRGPREVLSVTWQSEQALRLVLAPPDDYDYDDAHAHGFEVVVERPDWRHVARGSIGPEELGGEWVDFERPQQEAAVSRAVESLASLVGDTSWTPRRQVWDVQRLDDGRTLACAEGVLAEAWLPDGRLQWRVPDPEGGRQLVARPETGEVWVVVDRRRMHREGGRWVTIEPPLTAARVCLADGRRLGTLQLGFTATLTHREDGWLALRRTGWDDWKRPGPVALVPPGEETPAAMAELSGFDLVNHPFRILRSRRLLFLQGDAKRPHMNKWVVAVEPSGPTGEPVVRRLFPLEWDSRRAGHLFGGPGVEMGTGEVRDLVHAGAVHDGAGLLPGNAFVVRRGAEDGAVRWVFTCDHPATAVDGDEDTVYVALNSGELVALSASDGTVRWRGPLEVHGRPVVALSLVRTGPGELLIGTTDGRILDCAIAAD